jgi:hypothetical protein
MTRLIATVAAIWRGLTTRPPVTSRDELSWLDQHDSMRYWDGNPDDPTRPWLHDGGLPHATYANAVDRLGKAEADRFNDVVRRANEPRQS